ncbi:MAG: hypothetical protein HC765_02025 [Brachymonas sp.]|nr:hypothetical protein [Brachymonas sp.]
MTPLSKHSSAIFTIAFSAVLMLALAPKSFANELLAVASTQTPPAPVATALDAPRKWGSRAWWC